MVHRTTPLAHHTMSAYALLLRITVPILGLAASRLGPPGVDPLRVTRRIILRHFGRLLDHWPEIPGPDRVRA